MGSGKCTRNCVQILQCRRVRGSEESEARFQTTRTIPGTRKLHSFAPVSTDTVAVREYSLSDSFRKEMVTKQGRELEIDQITGFVTCVYDGEWWLACVLDVDSDNAEVKVTFLHPHGPTRSFKYPSLPDILTVSVSDILTKVSPRTTTSGRMYTLTAKESRSSNKTHKSLNYISTTYIFCITILHYLSQ